MLDFVPAECLLHSTGKFWMVNHQVKEHGSLKIKWCSVSGKAGAWHECSVSVSITHVSLLSGS